MPGLGAAYQCYILKLYLIYIVLVGPDFAPRYGGSNAEFKMMGQSFFYSAVLQNSDILKVIILIFYYFW